MDERAPDRELSAFKARLDRVKSDNSAQTESAADRRSSGYGMAFAIVADLVGGLAAGAALGWFFDRWLASAPFGLVVFFFLGAVAGMWNVYRTVRGYDMSFGFGRPPGAGPAHRGETEIPTGARSENEGGDHRGQSTASIRSGTDHPDSHRRT